MGRSVSYLSHALGITYFSNDPTNDNGKVVDIDENDNEFERSANDDDYSQSFDDLLENIIAAIESKYPSLSEPHKKLWDGNETRIILTNNWAEIGISEYCSLVSLSIRVNSGLEEKHGLAEQWIKKVWPSMVRHAKENTYHNNLCKVASFSNGEGVFELSK